MNKKVNNYNLFIGTGVIASLEHLDKEGLTRFFFKAPGLFIPVYVKDAARLPIKSAKDGDSINLEAKLRHSTGANTYKLMATRVELTSKSTNPINIIILEGDILDAIRKDEVTGLNFEHQSVTPSGNVFTMLIKVFFRNARSVKVIDLVDIGSAPYMIHGALQGTTKALRIDGVHIRCTTPIMLKSEDTDGK